MMQQEQIGEYAVSLDRAARGVVASAVRSEPNPDAISVRHVVSADNADHAMRLMRGYIESGRAAEAEREIKVDE